MSIAATHPNSFSRQSESLGTSNRPPLVMHLIILAGLFEPRRKTFHLSSDAPKTKALDWMCGYSVHYEYLSISHSECKTSCGARSQKMHPSSAVGMLGCRVSLCLRSSGVGLNIPPKTTGKLCAERDICAFVPPDTLVPYYQGGVLSPTRSPGRGAFWETRIPTVSSNFLEIPIAALDLMADRKVAGPNIYPHRKTTE